jgi:hypothetical protein
VFVLGLERGFPSVYVVFLSLSWLMPKYLKICHDQFLPSLANRHPLSAST